MSALEEMIRAAELAVIEHHPTAESPTVCLPCTRRGIGNNMGPVTAPCSVYMLNRRFLQSLGRPRPVG